MKINLKDFFDRNRPVFIIGGITLIVFVLLIIFSLGKKAEKPGMIELTGEEAEYIKVDYEFPKEMATEVQLENTQEGAESETSTEVLTEQQIFDNRFGVIVIKYTKNGFSPKNTKALKGQLVRWENKTDQNIYLKQLTNIYQELIEPKLITPNGFFELRLSKDKLWTYQERDTKATGSIFVLELAEN